MASERASARQEGQTRFVRRARSRPLIPLGSVAIVVLLGAGCARSVEGSGGSGGESAGENHAPVAVGSASEFGPCEDVTLEEFQQIFGDRFTAVKVGGTAPDCTIVARDTAIGESLTIRDSDRAGYGSDFDAARAATENDHLCPGSVHDVGGLGDRAFYATTCDPAERPNESLHIEVDGHHIAYSAFFVPADRITTTEDALRAIADRQLG